MWTAFQAHYRPTVAYQVTVVLIESKVSRRAPLPVRARRIYVVPFKQPLIQQIRSQDGPGAPIVTGQPILAGFNLVIVGSQLKGDNVRVDVGGTEQMVAEPNVTDTQIIVPIPPDTRAGLQSVQVKHDRLMGDPPVPHRGVDSNLAAFVLRPRIDTVGVTGVIAAADGTRSGDVTMTVAPLVGDTQRVQLLLNQLQPVDEPISSPLAAAQSASYTFFAPSRIPLSPPSGPPGATATLSVPFTGVKPGTYLVRVQVDGADSPLTVDGSGRFASPSVVIP